MSWQDSLKNFLEQNPDLPQGPDETPSAIHQPQTRKPRLDLVLDRKGRKGKTATIVCGFPDTISDDEIASLAATLKQRLGTGGSSRGGEILIQGDRRADLQHLLATLGYPTRLI